VYYLIVIAFVLGGAMLREMNLLLILAGMLAGPLLFNWWLVAVTLAGLEVRRRTPHAICAGDLLVVTIEIANKRKKTGSFALVVEERVEREANTRRNARAHSTLYFPHLPAGQRRTGTYRGRLAERGRYQLGPLKVSSRFPFGLVRRTVTAGQTDTLYVFPRLGRLARGWRIAQRHQDFEGAQRRQRRPSRVPGDLFGVRQWMQGDSPRWVHWRSSARHDVLVIRQFEEHRNPDVAVLVDLWQPRQPNHDDLLNVELAVSFAATVVAEVCRKGGGNLQLGVTGEDPQYVAGPVSVALLNETMEQLAVAGASDEDRLPALLDRVLPAVEPGTEVVLVSTRRVDLEDSGQLPPLWSTPARRRIARAIRPVNVSDGSLSQYFTLE
jgi:uncharacterized protein (DUF58 family)